MAESFAACLAASRRRVPDAEPEGGLIGRCPRDSVFLKGQDVDVVSRFHLERPVFELQFGGALQDEDPFVLRLFVPEVAR